MNQYMKFEIRRMREEDVSYAAVADALELPVGTVKTFCRREKIDGLDESQRCTHCRKPMQPSFQKTRRFCSDACRMAWWKKHPERRNPSTMNTFGCAFCGKEFTSAGKRVRKYCSRKCYGRSKVGVHAG